MAFINITKNKNMILGVSDWLSPKINVEAKYIRIGFVVAFLFAGVGLGLYLILWIVKLLSK
ncbi:hypothetical protein BTO15_05390 [Polaribacter sejongensis]|uniref:Phage shock protein PspC N-terminal domain-containing protein n=2 Tax=Polaribacter sejongensis TaxID=985043 RepID=A0ABM6PXV0_9FLAO|nr:hypothetical protein BTO15_05390 [Polaribacter sejongensis]